MGALAQVNGFGKVCLWLTGFFLSYGALAYVPSPFAIFELFETVPELSIPKLPTLKLKTMPAIEDFSTIAERPLFNKDRKPDPEPKAVAAPGQPAGPPPLVELTQFRLIGIVKSTERAIALIRNSAGTTLTLEPGGTLEGWTVETIDADGATFTAQGRQERLTIPKAVNNAPEPKAVPQD